MDITKKIKYIDYFKKPKVIYSSITVLAICIIVGLCLTNPISKKPPTLEIITTTNTFKACQSSYTWNWPGGGVASDSPSPYDMLKTENASKVESNSTIVLNVQKDLFNRNNIQEVECFYLWLDNKPQPAAYDTFKNNKLSFKAPEKEGLYIYSVVLKYPHGTSSYGFKLDVYDKAIKLPAFQYETEDKIEGLVYKAALAKYAKNKIGDSVVIVAPHIFGTYENGNELKIFTTVYYAEFKLYNKTLSEQNGGIVPAAIIYTKNNDGTYGFKQYVEAMDGSYFQKSIEEFCKPRNDIAKEIMTHYSNYKDLFTLMEDTLIKYLNKNGLQDIKLKQNDGIIVPLT